MNVFARFAQFVAVFSSREVLRSPILLLMADWKLGWVWIMRDDDVVSLPDGAIPCGTPIPVVKDRRTHWRVYFWEKKENRG